MSVTGENPEQRIDQAVAAVYARCLACGFKGKLYGMDSRIELQELRAVACSFLADAARRQIRAFKMVLARPTKKRSGIMREIEPWLHILVPAVITCVWYFVCMDIVAGTVSG